MAAALGVKVVGVLSAEEGGPVVVPMRDMAMARMAESAAVQTPVEPGTINVRATVSVTLEVAP